MWQFARQRTWEGRDLRASPDLIESIASALEHEHEPFARVAGELAESVQRARGLPVRTLAWSKLPAFLPSVELAPLGSTHVRVDLEGERSGSRLRVFTRGEAGSRYMLAATRLSEGGESLSRLELEPHSDPSGQLSIELDAFTRQVLITVTNVDDGTPDFDDPAPASSLTITIDHKD
jgi:hypothetical protein